MFLHRIIAMVSSSLHQNCCLEHCFNVAIMRELAISKIKTYQMCSFMIARFLMFLRVEIFGNPSVYQMLDSSCPLSLPDI